VKTSPNARSRLASAFSGQLPKIAMAPEGRHVVEKRLLPFEIVGRALFKPSLAFFIDFPQDEDADKAEEADEDILGM